jgi:hypothetical protein
VPTRRQYDVDWHGILPAITTATDLPCMLYNTPITYGTDYLAQQIARLAESHPNPLAVKESSTDVRRRRLYASTAPNGRPCWRPSNGRSRHGRRSSDRPSAERLTAS